MWTLYHLKFKRHFKAGHGEHGSSGRSTGADGKDVFIDVPLGTVIKDTETDQLYSKLLKINKKKLSLKEVWEDEEIGILKVLPIKHQDTLNLELLQKKKNHYRA